jgi:hypothetical protein
MFDPLMILLLGFMVFCVLGIIYCSWWGEKPPVIDLNKVIEELGYTREQYLESDEVADRCYEEVKRQGVEARLDYAIRREAHYKGVKQGLIAGAAVGAALYLGSTSDKK